MELPGIKTSSAGSCSSPTYSKTPLSPSLIGQNDTGQSQGHNRLPAQYQQPKKQADAWQVSPAGVGTAALVRQGYLSHCSLPK